MFAAVSSVGNFMRIMHKAIYDDRRFVARKPYMVQCKKRSQRGAIAVLETVSDRKLSILRT
jgi:hypothetical protein